MQYKNKIYRQSSFTLACYLVAKGQSIVGIEPTFDFNKKEFLFANTDQLKDLVDIYKFGDRASPKLMVNAHIYEQARRELLNRLKD